MSDVTMQTARVKTSAQAKRGKDRRWRTNLAGLGFVLPFFIVYALFLIWPIVLGLRMSFFNWTLSGLGSSDFLGLGNYQQLFSDSDFWQSLGVTLLFTVISTPLLIIVGFVLALLVNRAIPGQSFFRTVFFASYVLPVSVVVLIWSWLFQPGFGLINGVLTDLHLPSVGWLSSPNIALISVIIVTIWWTVGYNFLLYLAGMQQISPEMNEAASLDGAGSWARIRWITIPLLNRTTTMIIILQVIASLQLFQQAYLLMGSGDGPNNSTRSIVQYIYENGFTTFRVGFASAGSYVLFVIILIVSIGQFSLLARQRRNA